MLADVNERCSSLLTLDRAKASLALCSLNRSLRPDTDFRERHVPERLLHRPLNNGCYTIAAYKTRRNYFINNLK